MKYLIISFSHKNSTIEIREKLALSDEKIKRATLEKLVCQEVIHEAIIVSTCNRVELIIHSTKPIEAARYIYTLLAEHSGISLDELEGRADIYEDQGAVHHLFSVVSSLDSLVLGETQIVGQLKDAFRFSMDNGFCSQQLSRAMHYAFKCAAEVRNSTDISKKPVSVASVAVAKAKESAGLHGKRALILGAGEMSKIAIKNLLSHNCKVVLINRTYEKACELALECGEGVQVAPLEALSEYVNEVDFIFSATSSKEPVITDAMITKRESKRYFYDMAVPRDIQLEPRSDISLSSVDDLQDIVKRNIAFKEEEAKNSYEIIGRYTIDFFKWLQSLSVEPIVKQMYLHAKTAADMEAQRVLDKGFIPKEYEKEVKKMAEQTMNRFLHDITVKFRSISGESSADSVIESLKYLLSIQQQENLPNQYNCEYILKGNE